jgi:hypothetical protein
MAADLMTLKIDISTHPEMADKLVRLSTDLGVVYVPAAEWSRALADVGQFSPDGQFIGLAPLLVSVPSDM